MMYERDEWPKMSDGSDFNGKELLTLVRSGKSPFDGLWDVEVLIREIEENLDTKVVDIPLISKGSNNYGIHFQLSNRPDIVARMARDDINMPDFNGATMQQSVPEVTFEAAVYELLSSEPDILVSRLLYHRLLVECEDPKVCIPKDIAGRSSFLFEKAEGENNVWRHLDQEQRACLLTQSAQIRASLFTFTPPLDFTTTWLRERLFEQKPKSLPIPVAPTRDFCIALFISKIEATIKKIGDMIGWESDNATVGPVAAAAKQTLLRLIPHIMPADSGDKTSSSSPYRLVLEHGDFGIHNMSITQNATGEPVVTSLYDWETGCIVPALLSDPLMAVWVDLVTDEEAKPSYIRVPDDATADDHVEYELWARWYIDALFHRAPEYKRVIQAGRDARHLWFALRDWRGQDPEGYFGDLGAWAEKRMIELGVS